MSQELANEVRNIWNEMQSDKQSQQEREAHDLSFTWRPRQEEQERKLEKHKLEVLHLKEQIEKLKADGVKDYITTVVVVLSLLVNIVLANHIIG